MIFERSLAEGLRGGLYFGDKAPAEEAELIGGRAFGARKFLQFYTKAFLGI